MIEILQWLAVIVGPCLGVYFMWKEVGWLSDIRGLVMPTVCLLILVAMVVGVQIYFFDTALKLSIFFPEVPVTIQLPLLFALTILLYDAIAIMNYYVSKKDALENGGEKQSD